MAVRSTGRQNDYAMSDFRKIITGTTVTVFGYDGEFVAVEYCCSAEQESFARFSESWARAHNRRDEVQHTINNTRIQDIKSITQHEYEQHVKFALYLLAHQLIGKTFTQMSVPPASYIDATTINEFVELQKHFGFEVT